MRKALILLFLLAAVALLSTPASAAITWTLTDSSGQTLNSDSPQLPSNFSRSKPSSAGFSDTLLLLNCPTRPCNVGFPTGSSPANSLNGDTFSIRDISATELARIEKTDGASTDSFVVRGIKIVSLVNTSANITLKFATVSGDFSPVSSPTGNYAGAAKLRGEYRNSFNGGLIAATCNNGVSTPCVQLKVKIDLISLNGIGSNLSTVFTTSIPCDTASTSVSPCGSGGFYSPDLLSGDQFLSTDSGTVGCGTTCFPFWEGTLKMISTAQGDALTLRNSAGIGMGQATPAGVADLAAALGEGIDTWVGSCGGVQVGVQPYSVTGLPPFGNQGRTRGANATFPMKFSLSKAPIKLQGDPLPFFASINTINDPVNKEVTAGLLPAEITGNDTCSISWVPAANDPTLTAGGRPKFSAINQLKLNLTDFFTGSTYSGNPLLGDLPFFDCTACFRVEIQLVDGGGINQGTLRVNLGTNAGTFYTTDYGALGSPPPGGSSLPLIPDPTNPLRVDASGMLASQACCISLAEAQKNSDYGKLYVKAITVVIDQGTSVAANHLVQNLEAIVARSDRALNPLSPSSTANPTISLNPNSSTKSILTTGTPVASCDWPPVDGLKIYIYQVLDNSRTFVYNVLNPTVDSSCTLNANVNVTPTIFNAGTFEATVVVNSAASDAAHVFVGGVGIPAPGIMILK